MLASCASRTLARKRVMSAEPAKQSATAAALTLIPAPPGCLRRRCAPWRVPEAARLLASGGPRRLRLAQLDLVGVAVRISHHDGIGLPIPLRRVGAPAEGLDRDDLVGIEIDDRGV